MPVLILYNITYFMEYSFIGPTIVVFNHLIWTLENNGSKISPHYCVSYIYICIYTYDNDNRRKYTI